MTPHWTFLLHIIIRIGRYLERKCHSISRMGNMVWVELMGEELESRKLLGTEVAFYGGIWISFHDIPASLHSSTEFSLYQLGSRWFQVTDFDFHSLG